MASRGKKSARVVLNRRAVDQVQLAIADGVAAVGKRIIMDTRPPDAAPFGAGLPMKGGWLVYIGQKKVAGGGTDGRQPKKPRAFRTMKDTVIKALVGWGFPARFLEFGTTKMDPHPFFARQRDAIIPLIPGIIAKAAKYRIVRINRR